MKKFGSTFITFLVYYFFAWVIIIAIIFIANRVDLFAFLTVNVVFALMGLIILYQTCNGLILNTENIAVCNPLHSIKYRVLYRDILKIFLVDAFRNAYIEIYTNDNKRKKYFLKGFSKQDLLEYTEELKKKGVETKYISKR